MCNFRNDFFLNSDYCATKYVPCSAGPWIKVDILITSKMSTYQILQQTRKEDPCCESSRFLITHRWWGDASPAEFVSHGGLLHHKVQGSFEHFNSFDPSVGPTERLPETGQNKTKISGGVDFCGTEMKWESRLSPWNLHSLALKFMAHCVICSQERTFERKK